VRIDGRSMWDSSITCPGGKGMAASPRCPHPVVFCKYSFSKGLEKARL
jgi:hypothetical protein